jgi:hypothetical protein
MKTMTEYLEMDSNIAFLIAIYKRFVMPETHDVYTSVSGGFVNAVYDWSTHNISTWDECKNDKYTGFTVYWNDNGAGEPRVERVYIPNWVMEATPKNWGHAKNLFNKYLRVVQ